MIMKSTVSFESLRISADQYDGHHHGKNSSQWILSPQMMAYAETSSIHWSNVLWALETAKFSRTICKLLQVISLADRDDNLSYHAAGCS
jgi:hypothetical protein